jgi:DNA-formamidopyrimidine glycosylase
MPELPEVETIRIGLSALLPGKKIAGAWHDWPKGFPNSEEDVRAFLVGATILEVKRRAKVLLIELDTKYSLVIHLKMTGQLVYVQQAAGQKAESPKLKAGEAPAQTTGYPPPATADEVRFGAGHPNDSLIGPLPDKSTRVIFDLEEVVSRPVHLDALQGKGEQRTEAYMEYGEGAAQVLTPQSAKSSSRVPSSARKQTVAVHRSKLFFNDQRKFGWVRLLPTAEVPNIDFFKKVGPEPLAADFSAKDFIERLMRRPKSNIKAALLDQTVIAGVGNIYADESLFAARIHPAARVVDLDDRQKELLFHELRRILNLSIEKGGSSDKNYVDAAGRKGSYLSFANVFRREGQPCPRCGTIIIKTRVAGRGTHTCPTCQCI